MHSTRNASAWPRDPETLLLSGPPGPAVAADPSLLYLQPCELPPPAQLLLPLKPDEEEMAFAVLEICFEQVVIPLSPAALDDSHKVGEESRWSLLVPSGSETLAAQRKFAKVILEVLVVAPQLPVVQQ